MCTEMLVFVYVFCNLLCAYSFQYNSISSCLLYVTAYFLLNNWYLLVQQARTDLEPRGYAHSASFSHPKPRGHAHPASFSHLEPRGHAHPAPLSHLIPTQQPQQHNSPINSRNRVATFYCTQNQNKIEYSQN